MEFAPRWGPARMIVHPESSPCQGEIFHIICLARSDPVRVNFGLEIIIKKNGWNQKLKIAPIWMKLCAHTTEGSSLWEKAWSEGLKMANKGKPKFPTFCKKS